MKFLRNLEDFLRDLDLIQKKFRNFMRISRKKFRTFFAIFLSRPRYVGLQWGFIAILAALFLFARFVAFVLRNVGHQQGIHSNPRWRRSFPQGRLGIFQHMGGHKCSQVFVESVVLLCKSIQGKRFNIEVPIIFCSAAP